MATIASAFGVEHTLNLAWYKAWNPIRTVRTRLQFANIAATMSWVEHAVPAQELRVSVITCTRDRATLLAGAIESVQRQWHDRWEHVIVDDGSTDATPDVIAALTDPRVTAVRTTGVGLANARNAALDRASGDVIVYLDDDNRLHPCWSKAVAWAFSTMDVQTVFGTRVMEAHEPVPGCTATTFPGLQFAPYSRRRQRYVNAVDVGALAHRTRADVRFDPDERINTVNDWDYLRKLADTTVPTALPVIACHYATSGADRLSARPTSAYSLVASQVVAARHDRG
jgi:glycosyltransferase involved in cell wall biosynthesis